ncbi:hypothetical protein JOD82_002110 [Paenibacillus sp. 1182]|uniref:YopX family protein n=1 Tax=Paenibacillus sp. 1182 TaxID=2806565 RepID=UPI001AE28690|nr:YopX family protein [Paenibacillus sp. 1182]MBP1309090.1 hypothetical protein [Paenibacillus sp. 1182]
MSRPYRVWDTESKCFWENANKAHVGCIEQLFIGLSGDFLLRQNGTIIHESMFPGRFIRMDSTGMKDHLNEREIFDRDIVEYGNSGEKEKLRRGLVRYKKTYAAFVIESMDSPGREYLLVDCQDEWLAVIGNEFENHQLLSNFPKK